MTLKSVGNTRIGNSKRQGIPSADKTLPGPQQYSVVDNSVVFKKDPRPIFGSSERVSIMNANKVNPGPG
jgi:hypothetical protein